MSRKQASLPPTYDPTRHAKPAPFMDGEGVRGDGRAFHQCRPACLSLLPTSSSFFFISRFCGGRTADFRW